MRIQYADKQKWVKVLREDILSDFGKNGRKKVQRLLRDMDLYSITHQFAELDQKYLDWFIPLYQERIYSKENPNTYDIYATTLGKKNPTYAYYGLTLLEKGVPVGGTIFTLRKDRLSITYRSYLPDWMQHTDIACSPSLYAEYLITQHAKDNGKRKLVHGSDRNPYGLHSSIGIAIFKLSVGCIPFTQITAENKEIELDDITKNILVLELPKEKRRITTAYLYTSYADENKFEQLYKYDEHLHIETIYRDEEKL